MTKVAVTGASGHLGANLVRELIGRGYEVTAVIRNTSAALAGLDVTQVHADVLDQQSLCKAFNGVEVVYHLAAYVSIQTGETKKLQSINVDGTAHVIKACEAAGVATLVHFSSIHALDLRPLARAITEENPLLVRGRCPGGDYDFSKAEAELLVRENKHPGLSTRIIYPTAVFGPNDFNQSLLGRAIQKIAMGRLPVMVAGGFDWVDARDVAWGAVEATEKGDDKDRYIFSGHYLSMADLTKVISELTGSKVPGITCPIWLAKLFAPLIGAWARLRAEDPLYTYESLTALSGNMEISHSRASDTLGYQPREFRRSMRDALNFYANPNLTQNMN
jgi:dihydroflavonol-4-reductase